MTSALTNQLGDLVGPDGLVPGEALAGYAVDGLVPRAAVRPEDREAVSEVMRWASSKGFAVAPRGGGTRSELGNVPARLDAALDLTRCNRLLDFQPQDLTVTVEAGMTLETLQRELSQGGKSLLIESPQPAKSTIGGILATGFTGPRRAAYGLPRDWLIGIGVVGADGTQTKAGGRVVKNVTGYDLNKLYAGSLGTLGIIVEASFKLAPDPVYSGALIAPFPAPAGQPKTGGPGQALAAAQSLARQSYAPQGILVINDRAAVAMTTALLREAVLDREPGGRELGDREPGQWIAVAFLEGWNEDLVRQRAAAGAELLGSAGALEVVQLNQRESSEFLREASSLGWQAGSRPWFSMKLDFAPSQAAGLLEELSRALGGDREPGIVADPGFGTARLLWQQGRDEAPDPERSETDAEYMLATISLVREMVHRAWGTGIVETSPLEVKRRIDVWDAEAHGTRELRIMRDLKEKFDPAGILNPGRFLGGI